MMRSVIHHLLVLLFCIGTTGYLHASEEGNFYRHPTGFSFWYPQQWQLSELEEALQLVPGNAVTTQEGLSELYFVTGESVAGTGIMHAEDPQVITYIDQQVRSVLPALQLNSDRRHVDLMGTRGLILTWSGNNNAGKPVEGRAYIVIANNAAFTLSAIAFKGLIAKRDTSLMKIFRSFVLGEAKHDQALVGTWHKHSTAALANEDRVYQTAWSAAQSVSEDKSQLTFYPDGRFHRLNTSHTLVGAGGIWLEDNSKNEHKGQWFADGKRLYMIYDNNTWDEFAYNVVPTGSGRELRTADGKKATIWRQ